MRFKSFQSRILFFFLGLLTLVQGAGFLAVNRAIVDNARSQLDQQLSVSARVFESLMSERSRRLSAAVGIVSADFPFKQAIATQEPATILSALVSQRTRIGADLMMAASTDRRLLANTLQADPGEPAPFPFPWMIERAERGEAASSLVELNGQIYQLIAAPILAPRPIAWLFAGFQVDDNLAAEIRRITLSHVSFFLRLDGPYKTIFASSLDAENRGRMSGLNDDQTEEAGAFLASLGKEKYMTLTLPIEKRADFEVRAVLQRSLAEALKPYGGLQRAMMALFLLGFIAFTLGGLWVSRRISRPVKTLVRAVGEIGKGNYGHEVRIGQKDEIGILADAFNKMTKGLAERDRVRGLLGKVVAPAIAEELMNKELKLGGEQREVTILFSDIRRFTSLGEKLGPAETLDLLNAYMTGMTAIVERNGGVVDKYMGDMVMAVFGAPLEHEDDARRALICAIEMIEELERLNDDFQRKGLPRIEIGVGVNSGTVLAGNMGSKNRMNYTVIGDAVNVASRLEGLTKNKDYGASIIVSQATLARAGGDFEARPLGDVTVRGKSESTPIFALVGKKDGAPKNA